MVDSGLLNEALVDLFHGVLHPVESGVRTHAPAVLQREAAEEGEDLHQGDTIRAIQPPHPPKPPPLSDGKSYSAVIIKQQ